MRLLVLPRERNNPYQELLYGALGRHGVQVAYLGELTGSRTLNQLLLPLELVGWRLRGTRAVHLHWTYAFELYGIQRYPALRWVAQAWFMLWLYTLRLLGMRLVWTAHNVLPMPLNGNFGNDLHARRQLVAAASLVVSHSTATLDALRSLEMQPRRSTVIPHGPYTVTLGTRVMTAPGTVPGPRRFLFFGRVESYKGVDILLEAYKMLPAELDLHLSVVGECPDPTYEKELGQIADRSGHPVETRFERVPEEKVSDLLDDADVVVLPYRVTTTSGSAMLMLTHGRPLVVPDLPGLAELPGAAVVRYDGTVEGLSGALADLAVADAGVLTAMSAAGEAYCAQISWDSIGQRMFDELQDLHLNR
jgi:glycosyltransferase involved in cell wall biosynthesis